MLSSLSSKISTRATASRLLRLSNESCRHRITTAPSSSSKVAHPILSVRHISRTPSYHAQITVDVPTMGDSITEGTIVEWCVPPGSHVREGDILALIETDKVTVDIKADQDGMLVKQLGAVDDEVEVGTGLYVLDTDLVNADIVAPVVENVTNDVDLSLSEVNASLDAGKMEKVASPSSSATSARVPSIHFLGKEGWKEKLSTTDGAAASTVSATTTTTTVQTSNKPNGPTSITSMPYSSRYGRPPITDEEMEALILGGADEAPEMRSVVSEKEGLSGVVFVGGKVVTAGPRGIWLSE